MVEQSEGLMKNHTHGRNTWNL